MGSNWSQSYSKNFYGCSCEGDQVNSQVDMSPYRRPGSCCPCRTYLLRLQVITVTIQSGDLTAVQQPQEKGARFKNKMTARWAVRGIYAHVHQKILGLAGCLGRATQLEMARHMKLPEF